MTDEDLRREVDRLRAELDNLTRAVAKLVVQQNPHLADPMFHYYQAFIDGEHAFAADSGGSFSDWPGRPRPDLVPELMHTPPRQAEDVLPRGGRNPRIGCEQHDSGTWIHGAPHDCPTWARR